MSHTLYSLGVVLYELLAGCLPFASESPIDLRASILDGKPTQPRAINDQVPRQIERICLKAMARNAADRYSTAEDFANDLRSALTPRKSRLSYLVSGFVLLLVLAVGLSSWQGWLGDRKASLADQPAAQVVSLPVRPPNTSREEALHRGHVLFDQDRFAESLVAYSDAIRADSKSAEAFHRRGACHYNLGNNSEALADFTEANRLAPQDAEILKDRSSVNLRLGHYEQGIADAERAAEVGVKLGADYSSSVATAYSARGIERGKKEQLTAALDDFTKATTLRPNDAELFDQRGTAYFNLGRFEEAAADFDRAVGLDAKNDEYREHRRFAYARRAEARQSEADGKGSKKQP